MRIICESQNDYKMAGALCMVARAANIQVDVKHHEDAYALTVWSLDDFGAMNDERVKAMTRKEKANFMEYAKAQLRRDMVDRGWDSLQTLIEEYYSSGAAKEPQEEIQVPEQEWSGYKTLDEILLKYFGTGFPLPESPCCESYSSLIALINGIGNITGADVNDLVDSLDEVCNLNAFRDKNGELVYDEDEILRRREQSETDDEQIP